MSWAIVDRASRPKAAYHMLATSFQPFAISNTGYIVGSAINYNGTVGAAVILTPAVLNAVPEPETYAMLLAGLGLVGFAVRRRA